MIRRKRSKDKSRQKFSRYAAAVRHLHWAERFALNVSASRFSLAGSRHLRHEFMWGALSMACNELDLNDIGRWLRAIAALIDRLQTKEELVLWLMCVNEILRRSPRNYATFRKEMGFAWDDSEGVTSSELHGPFMQARKSFRDKLTVIRETS